MLRYTGNGSGNCGHAAEPAVVAKREPSAAVEEVSREDTRSLQVLGEVTCRTGHRHIIEIMQRRFEELRAAGRAGLLTADHFKRFGPVTLGPMLGVLGIKIVAVIDEEQFALISPRLTKAKFRRWSTGAKNGMPARRRPKSSYYFSKPGAASAARMAALEAMTTAKRSRLARHAARVRWAAVREAHGIA